MGTINKGNMKYSEKTDVNFNEFGTGLSRATLEKKSSGNGGNSGGVNVYCCCCVTVNCGGAVNLKTKK